MGEAFYDFLIAIFANAHNRHLAPDVIVSTGLFNLGMFVAYFWLTCTLLWFTTKSVLIKRTPLVYLFAAFIGLCGVGHLGYVLMYPTWLQLSVDFLSAAVSLITAVVLWQRRHSVLGIVFQFKYVIGLLKTLEKFDEAEQNK